MGLKIVAIIVGIAFGWMLGVFVAYVIAGPNFGQLPILTVPIGLAVGIVFALSPITTPAKRIAIMMVATAAIVFIVR